MFKRGQLLILEQGAYSDFAYAGPFRVAKDFAKSDAVAAFKRQKKLPDNTESAFVAWLARYGYIEDADTEHWYLGDYGFEPLGFEDKGREATRYSHGVVWRNDGDFDQTEEQQAAIAAEREAAVEARKQEFLRDPDAWFERQRIVQTQTTSMGATMTLEQAVELYGLQEAHAEYLLKSR